MSDPRPPDIDYREIYKDEIAKAKEAQRKRREREEANREPAFDYTVGFTCTEKTWEDIKTVIHGHETWNRSFRFYPAKDRQEKLPGFRKEG